MEIYIVAILGFIYIISTFIESPSAVRKIWTLSFMVAMCLMFASLFALRMKHQDVMLTVDNFNWYFFLYMFGALAFALGIINLWMYRHTLWNMFRAKPDTDKVEARKQ